MRGEDRGNRQKRIHTSVPMPMIWVSSTMKKSKTNRASMISRLNVMRPVHHSHSHMSANGGCR